MVKTIVKIRIPFTFVNEGTYEISINGQVASVVINYERNSGGMANMMNWEVSAPGASKLEMMPDHHGLVNKSNVYIEIPYYVLPVNRVFIMPDGQKLGPIEDHFGEIQRACLEYLNRLIEVVRFKTGQYWTSPLSSKDVFINEFNLLDEVGRNVGGALAIMPCGGSFGFENKIISQTNVQPQISSALKNEEKIPIYETLYLDSINYFSTGRFNEAVIMINIALEVFVQEYLFQKMISNGIESDEANKKITVIFSHGKQGGKSGLHKVLTVDFREIAQRSLEDNMNLWTLFGDARDIRKNTMHPRTTKLSEGKARKAMNTIIKVMNWVAGESKYSLSEDRGS